MFLTIVTNASLWTGSICRPAPAGFRHSRSADDRVSRKDNETAASNVSPGGQRSALAVGKQCCSVHSGQRHSVCCLSMERCSIPNGATVTTSTENRS